MAWSRQYLILLSHCCPIDRAVIYEGSAHLVTQPLIRTHFLSIYRYPPVNFSMHAVRHSLKNNFHAFLIICDKPNAIVGRYCRSVKLN